MKTLAVIILLLFSSAASRAGDLYRTYLLARIYTPIHASPFNSIEQKEHSINFFIPRYKIPTGNVFCRMEDKLTKATKVWITVGVK